MTLEQLNGLDREAAEEVFLRCCGSTRWAREMAARRPFHDAAIMAHDPRFADRFRHATPAAPSAGFAHTLYPDSYGADLAKPGFCGGSNPQRNWMSRDPRFFWKAG